MTRIANPNISEKEFNEKINIMPPFGDNAMDQALA